MFVITKLHLNKFQPCSIPSNRDYVKRFGLVTSVPSYSGDELIPQNISKIESLRTADYYNRIALRDEISPVPSPEPEAIISDTSVES